MGISLERLRCQFVRFTIEGSIISEGTVQEKRKHKIHGKVWKLLRDPENNIYQHFSTEPLYRFSNPGWVYHPRGLISELID